MKLSTAKIIYCLFAGCIVIATLMYFGPQYKVYRKQKEGEAELAHAKYQREVQVYQAKGEYEAAQWLADKDTVRAHGIARSNEIIGNSLKRNKEYLQWLWIEQLDKANVIYIPTEGNMPLLEAGRGHSNVSITDTLP